MFDLMEIIFPVMFILIVAMIIFTFAKGIQTWHDDNNSPRITITQMQEMRQVRMDIIQLSILHTMLPFRWKTGTRWRCLYLVQSTGCLLKETRANCHSRVPDICHFTRKFEESIK